ncbi:hypothetical protein SODG_002222 [Sodalis praecaptivus]
MGRQAIAPLILAAPASKIPPRNTGYQRAIPGGCAAMLAGKIVALAQIR